MKKPLKAIRAGDTVGMSMSQNDCFTRFNPATKEAYQEALVRATGTIAVLLRESKASFDKLDPAARTQPTLQD